MKSNPVKIVLVLIVLGVGGYIWIDPGKPSETDLRGPVLAALSAPASSGLQSVSVGRSFVGRRSRDSSSHRVWPVHANVGDGTKPTATQNFYLWKESDGSWKAEIDNLLNTQWENRGFFGLGFF